MIRNEIKMYWKGQQLIPKIDALLMINERQIILMIINQISLEGTLFVQAFKAFVDGEKDTYMNLLPILSYQFPEIQTVLLHKTISQLISFLKKAKEVVSTLSDPDNLVPAKLNSINSFLNKAYLKQWQDKYQTVNEMTTLGAKRQEKGQYDSAIFQYKQSLDIMPTQHAHAHLANLYLIKKQPQLFRNHIVQAVKFGSDNSLLPVYLAIFQKIQKRQKNYELYLCSKVMISFGSKEISAYFAYIREAVRRKEKIDEKTITEFPQSFQKTICKGIMLKNQEAVQYFLRVQKQITNKISYPNSLKHKESPQCQFWDKIDIFYVQLSRACANSFVYRDDRNYYLQKGLNYNPNSWELLRQTLVVFNSNPILVFSTAQQLNLMLQAFTCLQSSLQQNQQRILDCQMIQIFCDILGQIQSPRERIIPFINQAINQYPKYHQLHLLAAKFHLQYGNIAQSESHCSQGLKLNPNSAEAHFMMGNIQVKKKQFSKAKSFYKKSLQINKKYFSPLFSLAALHYSEKRYNSCIELLQQAKSVEATDIQLRRLYQLLVKAYNRLNQFDKAEEEVLELIETAQIKQLSGDIAYSFAEVKFNKGSFNEALKYYQQAIKVYPKHYQSHYKLILTQLIQNPNLGEEHISSMLQNARILISLQKTDTQCLTLYGYLLIKSGNFNQAVDVLFESINRNEQSCYAYYHLGRLFKEHRELVKEEVMNRLGQRIQQLSLPTRYYANIFSFLAAGSHEEFLYNFDTFFKYHKHQINRTKNPKHQFQKMFNRIIGNFHYLNALYPNSNDLLIITAMLYRTIGESQIVQTYIQRLLLKYRTSKQPLFDVLFEFYNRNFHYHKLDNYFAFILEFIFQEMLEHHPWELMRFRDKLGDGLDKFRQNRAVNTCITNYLSKISMIVKGFQSIINQPQQQINAFNNHQPPNINHRQLFLKHVQSKSPKKAYSSYSNIDLSLFPEAQNQINNSKGMQIIAQQLQVYQDRIKSEGQRVQLLTGVTNLEIMKYTFESVWPFVQFVQDKKVKSELLYDLTKTIQQLLDVEPIGKLLEFINVMIGHYSSSRQPQEQQPTTSITCQLLSNLHDDELQSTIFSSHRNHSSSPFSLQLPKSISHCKQFAYSAQKPYKSSTKKPFNSSIIHIQSQISSRAQSSTIPSSILQQDFDQNDYNY